MNIWTTNKKMAEIESNKDLLKMTKKQLINQVAQSWVTIMILQEELAKKEEV